MLTLITGKTGSGKSYKIISDILAVIETRKVITNIHMNLTHENYIYKDESQIRDYIDEIAILFKEVKSLPLLIEDLKEKEFFGAFFVIDECHLVGFRKKLDPIINWLSVHRHINQDVYLVTQTLKKIDPTYYPDIHFHYDMIASNKRVNKDLIGWYKYDEIGGDKIQTKYIKPNKEIFEIYKTGQSEKSSNVFMVKLVLLVAFFFLMLMVMYYFFTRGMSFQDNVADTNQSTPVTSINKPILENQESNETIVKCDFYINKPRDFTMAVKLKQGYHVCIVEKVL